MEKARVQPNLGTMNSILETLSTLGNIREAKSLCLQTLSEFKGMGIEPSLASYYFILITYCKERKFGTTCTT
jgi:pentatricopeptide repeat domain-containing protein 3